MIRFRIVIISLLCAGCVRDASTVTHEMVEAMGGKTALSSVRYIRFNFEVFSEGKKFSEHRHLWDRYTGKYRVEGKARDGEYCVLFDDIYNKIGRAYSEDNILKDSALADKIKYGYRRYINDTYWLLMPWKWEDPGVQAVYEGVRFDSLTGVSCDVIKLTFDSVGLTPKDTYWAYVDTKTHLMVKWVFELQDNKETGEFRWADWITINGVKFSQSKVGTGKTTIKTTSIQILNTIDPRVFEDPKVTLP